MAKAPVTPSVSVQPRIDLREGTPVLVRVPSEDFPSFLDDEKRESLIAAVRRGQTYYETQPPERLFSFGVDRYTARDMAEGLRDFALLVESNPPDLADRIKRAFVVYRSVGVPPDGSVVFSSYYEHSLRASLRPSKRFAYPLYARPPDLQETRGEKGETVVSRRVGGVSRPYWTREDIDTHHRLKGQGLEIAWAEDPVDVFFLQVQGSGWLLLEDGRRWRVRYAGNNGHPYRSVGGSMIERGILDRKTFSREKMVAYLSEHPRERAGLLNVNPRYVFFRIDTTDRSPEAFGSLGVPLVPWRSIATDPAVYPPGALAWMETTTKNKVARFVMNQDEGGAIKGPGRVDYFVGGGPEAQTYAVGFWEKGRLFFLAPERGGQRSATP